MNFVCVHHIYIIRDVALIVVVVVAVAANVLVDASALCI